MFGHILIHSQSRGNGARTVKRNLKSFKNSLYLAVFSVQTMKRVPDNISILKSAMRFMCQTLAMPFTLFRNKNVQRFVSFRHISQSSQNMSTRPKRSIVVIGQTATQHSDSNLRRKSHI